MIYLFGTCPTTGRDQKIKVKTGRYTVWTKSKTPSWMRLGDGGTVDRHRAQSANWHGVYTSADICHSRDRVIIYARSYGCRWRPCGPVTSLWQSTNIKPLFFKRSGSSAPLGLEDRTLRGEYIDFALLLPNSIYRPLWVPSTSLAGRGIVPWLSGLHTHFGLTEEVGHGLLPEVARRFSLPTCWLWS